MRQIRKKNDSLLETLAMGSDCVYLSDLHMARQRPRVRLVLEQIESTAFKIEEWNGAIAYLIGDSIEFEDAEQAKNYLLQRL